MIHAILAQLYAMRGRQRRYWPWFKIRRACDVALGRDVDIDALEEALAQMVAAGEATVSRVGWWFAARERRVHEPEAGIAAGW